MSEVAIKVDHLSKKFCRSLKRSLWYGVKDMFAEFVNHKNKKKRHLRKGEFWALSDISFEVKRGEILGIIGPNGAGKTTLLRVLNGLIKPDRGSVLISGRVGALIALGAGFNPVLTGRENIYISAAVLGIPKRDVDKKLEEIISFAEIGEFINAPIRSYSAGMKVRLGFSVAVNMSPHILLVDEVLAVGDMAFKRKAEARIKKMLLSGMTVLFISHNLTQVARLCPKVIHLEKGRIKAYGDSNDIIANYYLDSAPKFRTTKLDNNKVIMRNAQLTKPDLLDVESVQMLNGSGIPKNIFETFEDITLRICYKANSSINNLLFRWKLSDKNGTLITILNSMDQLRFDVEAGPGIICCRLSRLPFNRGVYSMGLIIGDEHGVIFYSSYLTEFMIGIKEQHQLVNLYNSSILELEHHWFIEKSTNTQIRR